MKPEQEPLRYIELDELEKLINAGIPLHDLPRFLPTYTATNVSVAEHLEYLRAIGALTIQDGRLVRTQKYEVARKV
jgi:hypothetical protein